MMFRSRAAQTTILAAGSALALIKVIAGARAHAEEISTQAIQSHLRAFQLAKSRPLLSSAKTNTQFRRARVLVAS
jgi:type II secretory pathway pseudopilin PulG